MIDRSSETMGWVYVNILWSCVICQVVALLIAAVATYLTGNPNWLWFLTLILTASPSLCLKLARPLILEPETKP